MKIASLACVLAAATLAACGPSGSETPAAMQGASSAPSWLPAGVTPPTPHRVLNDFSIGKERALQIIVDAQPDAIMIGQWREALQAGGYEVRDDMSGASTVVFHGRDVRSGSFGVSEYDDGGWVITYSVSLD